MKEKYKIVYKEGVAEIEEKKSRFIATVRPVESEEEAFSFIAAMRKKYWDASHNCYAFVIGVNNETMRAGDDGEPAQTAGRPMLDVLLGEQVHNTCVVVTRYFGGTLLGTGGLVRAYGGAAKAGLLSSVIVEKCLADQMQVLTDYTDLGKIQYIAAEEGAVILESSYSDTVALKLLIPAALSEGILKKLTEGTGGRCRLLPEKQVYYGVVNKEILVF